MEPPRDMYRERFKFFKTYSEGGSCSKRRKLNNPLRYQGESADSCEVDGVQIEDLDQVLLRHPDDCDDSLSDNVLRRNVSVPVECKCFERWGLREPSSWTVVELKYPSGLIVIKNPFTPEGQRYWISRTLLDFAHHPEYITNMDNLNRLEKIKRGEVVDNFSDFKLNMSCTDFYDKLRWVTFGYHHDWDTKVYTEKMRSKFPEDLADMTKYISELLGFTGFEAEAAIANYYHMDSTLSGHVDRSEVNQFAPLFSLSFGQTAIFLIGGQSKSDPPQPVLLQSGDIAVMSGESRLSYHGVPKILPATNSPWEDVTSSPNFTKRPKLITNGNQVSLDAKLSPTDCLHNCNTFSKLLKDPQCHLKLKSTHWTNHSQNYISKSRINLNIRQVLFPGQENLNCSKAVSSLN